MRALWRDKPRVVYGPSPMDLVFIKTLWGETEPTTDSDADTGTGAPRTKGSWLPEDEAVDEALALRWARVMEGVYSDKLCRHPSCRAWGEAEDVEEV